MAMASDGKQFSGRQAMLSHERKMKHTSPAPEAGDPIGDPHGEHEQHSEMATCPACGHEFEPNPKEEHAEEQVHPGIHEEIQHGGY